MSGGGNRQGNPSETIEGKQVAILGNSRSDCSTTTLCNKNNSSPLAMSLASAVRGVCVVPIVTHRLQAACIGRKLSHVKSNAKGKAIIIQDSRSGEVDRMNIEDSCRPFLSNVAWLNMILPVHCCDGWGEGKLRAASVLLGGEAPSILESEGASFLLATCPSSQRQQKIILHRYPYLICAIRAFCAPTTIYSLQLHAKSEMRCWNEDFEREKELRCTERGVKICVVFPTYATYYALPLFSVHQPIIAALNRLSSSTEAD